MKTKTVYRKGLLIILGGLLTLLAACSAGSTPTAIVETAPTATNTVTVKEAEPTRTAAAATEDPYMAQRDALVDRGIVARGINDPSVIEAMRTVPRHEFVPEDLIPLAYANQPLPIGYGQTISQPYIVALMTEAVAVSGDDNVLEIGTGSAYQAAVLAELVDHVYTIEIIGALVDRASETLERLGYDNVTVRHADGYFGWEEHAPFDAIVVTAAPDHIPQPLVDQLKIGGRLIIPVGPVGGFQTLWLLTRVSDDEVRTENLGGVAFVPLTRAEDQD